jgi:deoxyadenosine/deoxycytidine kinase
MPYIFTVNGIPGSGKSTLLQHLLEFTVPGRNVVILQENVEDWEKNDLLKNYYSDPENYAFTFQLYVLLTSAYNLEKVVEANPHAVILVERDPTSNFMFASMLHTQGKMTELDFSMYTMVYDRLKKIDVVGQLFLTCDPGTALERCEKRKRGGEDKITLEYLQELSEYEEEFIENQHFDSDVFYVNSDGDLENYVDEVKSYVKCVVAQHEHTKSSHEFLKAFTVLNLLSLLFMLFINFYV